ncbi:MAG: M20 family metallopeptidase [marine benthic group bacterium]|nr:M20 family metallopeptidase [Gemmatimonadota bacterium]
MVNEVAPRILEHLLYREREMVRLLSRLSEAESPSLDAASQAGPQAILRLELERLGFVVRTIPGVESGGQLLAIPHGRPKNRSSQLLVGHCDTVWETGTLDTMPVIEKGGRLYGPGTYDMKGGLVNILFALRALQTLGLQPEVTPIVLVNSDEEIGSCDSMRHIKRLAKVSERVFVLEPALGPAGKLKTARKGNGFFEIRVLGRAAHAGLEPERGASAILELSMVIQRLFALNDAERGITVNVGTIDGGLRTNIVAPESRATVDIRVLTIADARRIEAEVLSLEATTPGTELVITGTMNRPPMERTPGNQHLWELAEAAGRRLGLHLQQGTSGGGSDGNVTSLFTPTLDGLGPMGDGAHASHEHVVVRSLPERAALLAMLLLEPSMAEVARANHGNPARDEAEALLKGANSHAHQTPRA